MKLLLFSPYYPPHTGGLETHSAELNHHLATNEAVTSITVFTPHFPETAPTHETINDKIKIIRFPAIEVIPNYPLPKFWDSTFRKLYREIGHESYDLVLSRTRFFTTSLAALVYSKTHHLPWMHIEHGSDFIQLANPITNLIGRIYDYTAGWLIFHFSTVNVAISQAVAGFVRRFTRRPSPVIYRGIEKQAILDAPEDTEIAKQYADKILIGFVGRLIDGKGVMDLVTAMSQLNNPNAQLLIVGDGPQRQRLEQYVAELGLTGQIHFFGSLPTKQAMGIIKTCRIFVNPSYTEGLPTSVIEAALCKTAIIATDVGGTREIITDKKDGFLIKPKDITMLVDKLSLLIDDEALCSKFSETVYSEVNQRFSWKESSEHYIALMKKVVKA
jgi:glycosyltransferase involved in cell wall biosynthesis